VFAGGFDLQSACAVAGSDNVDDYAVLDLLDALVRKSLLVADRSSGRTRFSMLETIRQFAEEQLVARGEASEIRAAHSRYFAGREADIMARWDSPRQREAYAWFSLELANLRTAFRWAADQGDLDVAAPIATYAGWLGTCVHTLEPIAWAEELIESARAVDHARLATLYVIASLCFATGRVEAAVGYAEAGQIVVGRSRDALPYGIEAALGVVYLAIGQPERCVEWCRAQLARRRDNNAHLRAWLVSALALAGSGGEAMDSADGLIEAAEATGNPSWLALALGAYGSAFRDADPVGALNAGGRGLVIAQDTGNRAAASTLANTLARLEAEHGDPVAALDHLTLAPSPCRHGLDYGEASPTLFLGLLNLGHKRLQLAGQGSGHRKAGRVVQPLCDDNRLCHNGWTVSGPVQGIAFISHGLLAAAHSSCRHRYSSGGKRHHVGLVMSGTCL
jgi:hypothetical protein